MMDAIVFDTDFAAFSISLTPKIYINDVSLTKDITSLDIDGNTL